MTRDVDFAIGEDPGRSQQVAEEIIHAIGFRPTLGFIPGLGEQRRKGGVLMVTSMPREGELTGIIDILLPGIPWVPDAVQRARSNRIDLGFARVPVITPEDLIVAKCYALNAAPDRFQDLDDLKELFGSVPDLDLDYAKVKLEALGLTIPKVLRSSAPPGLRKLCK